MKIGIISDAHGNFIGLKKCLDYLYKKVDRIYFLGDSVGYFPFPNEVIDELAANNVECLLGNHDAMLIGSLSYDNSLESLYQIKLSKQKIRADNLLFLKKLLPLKYETISGKRILFVHGSPHNPLMGYIYPDTEIEFFQNLPVDIIFMGHTHRPFVKEKNKVLFVNVGSSGLPRDIGNRLSLGIYDSKKNKVELEYLYLPWEEIKENFQDAIHESVIKVLQRT